MMLLLVLCLSACRNETASANQTIEIALWDENAKSAVDKAIANFNKKHPNVQVKVTYSPFAQYWTTLRTSIGGGSGPDLFWMNAVNFYQYAEAGLIKDLEGFITNDTEFSKDDYYQSMIELYSYKDKLYGAPYFVDAVGIYYNKKLFDKAGISYPDETWTWEDIERVGEQLTNRAKGVYGYAAPILSNQTGYYNYIHQAGGEIVSRDQLLSGFDSKAARESFAFIEHLVDKGISPDVKSQIQNDLNQMFMSDKLAMLPAISVMSIQFNEAIGDHIDIAPLPKGKEEASIVHGISWVMNEKADNERLSWELMKELTSETGNKEIAKSGFSTPAGIAAGDLWLESIPHLNLQVFIDAQKNGTAYPLSRNTMEWQRIEQTEIQGAFLEQSEMNATLERVASEMNRILRQGKNME
jgi:multiple sugar transport system substrate-binding protein